MLKERFLRDLPDRMKKNIEFPQKRKFWLVEVWDYLPCSKFAIGGYGRARRFFSGFCPRAHVLERCRCFEVVRTFKIRIAFH